MPAAPRTEQEMERLARGLEAGARARGARDVRLVETHISWVLLAGDRALKLKKPVVLPFADFGTGERRRALCHDEVRLNRRLAPELYLGVVPVGGPLEAPEVGVEPALEWAVEMARFPDGARLDELLAADAVDAAELEALGERIARFHGGLEPDRGPGGRGRPEAVVAAALENFDELEGFAADAGRPLPDDLAALARWTRERGEALTPALAAREREGAIVEGHGDLHSANVARVDGRLVPFDHLEFNADLRWSDRMAELAFLTMDLAVRGRRDLGCAFLNRALEVSGDYAGLAVLRFYEVYRALVRAKVAAIGRLQHGAGPFDGDDPHVAFAAGEVQRPAPLLVLTRGLSGSGKSTVARALLPHLGGVRVRSDLERKRLAGLAPGASSHSSVGAGLYTEAASADTYGRLLECARAGLAGGVTVVVDATFLRRSDRDRFRDLAEDLGAAQVVLACTAPLAVLEERVARRAAEGADPSEATVDVLRAQAAAEEPLGPDEAAVEVRTDRDGDPARLAEAIRSSAGSPRPR